MKISLGLSQGLIPLSYSVPTPPRKDHLIRNSEGEEGFSFLFSFPDILTVKVIINGENSAC